jgi:hypothetical protein
MSGSAPLAWGVVVRQDGPNPIRSDCMRSLLNSVLAIDDRLASPLVGRGMG